MALDAEVWPGAWTDALECPRDRVARGGVLIWRWPKVGEKEYKQSSNLLVTLLPVLSALWFISCIPHTFTGFIVYLHMQTHSPDCI